MIDESIQKQFTVAGLTSLQNGAVFSGDHPYRLWAELALPANAPNRDAGVFMVELLLSHVPVPRHVLGDAPLPTDRVRHDNGTTCIARPAHLAYRPMLMDWVLQLIALPWQVGWVVWCGVTCGVVWGDGRR